MHNHKHCHHKLNFCEQCNIAYCEKCGKEWRSRPYYYYPYYSGSYTVNVGETYPTDGITGVHNHG